jgi:hypothetical protein
MKMICLNGPPQAGKDTTAELIQHLIYTSGKIALIDKFAEPLNAIAQLTLGMDNSTFQLYREKLKDDPLPDFPDRTMREVLIAISEDYIKPLFGEDYFGVAAFKRSQNHIGEADYMIYSDSGFQVEFDKFRELTLQDNRENSVMLIQIDRDRCNYDNDSREYVYPQDSSTICINIKNNKGISDLEENIKNLIEKGWI